MQAVLATVACLAVYALAYRFYARYLGRRVFALDPARVTPAHRYTDDVDYVPTRRPVLFGHHFASITGLSPMLGPAIAVIWGWLPAMIWVVLGAVLVGCVHDFGALVVSLRARGLSIGAVAEGVLGRRAMALFHAIIFFLVALAMGVFVYVVADLFHAPPDLAPLSAGARSTADYPEAILPSAVLMLLAVGLGVLTRRGWPFGPLSAAAFALTLAGVFLGMRFPIVGPTVVQWEWILLGYAFVAAVLPVWLLLQARDFINSLLLYLGLGAMYLGLFVMAPRFVAPAVVSQPEGAPPLLPFVFIFIACGAASGFHALVSSGTTAKQLDNEAHAPSIGYGGMIGESLLGLMAVLACTAGFLDAESWHAHYGVWDRAQGLAVGISAFIGGTSRFIAALGVPESAAAALVAVVVVSFALTTLDSATRLLRFNLEEIGSSLGLRALGNRFLASGLAVLAIAWFAFYEIGGKPAGLALWALFGTTNQLLAGLALLVVTLYLYQRGRPVVYTLVPMVFMLANTLVAMAIKLGDFWRVGATELWVLGAVLWVLGAWLAVEAVLAWLRYRRRDRIDEMEIEVSDPRQA